MATHVGIGFNDQSDMVMAAKNAAFDAKLSLEQQEVDLAIVFATVQYDFKTIMPTISSILNASGMIGASTSGIILSDQISHQGISVITIASDTIQFGTGHVDNIPAKDPYKAGYTLAQETLKSFGQGPRQTFLFFADGRLENTSLILKGLQDVLGNAFSIVGAGSCDDFHFKHSYQSYENNTLQHSAVGLCIGGMAGIGISGRHGWRPLGKPRKITSSHKNVIKTIDGKKASYIYEDYFGHESKKLEESLYDQMGVLYPLGIFIDRANEYLIRNPINILPDGSIVCQGEVPKVAEVHIMIGNKESCLQAAREAAQEAKNQIMPEQAKLVIVLESMARQKLFGRRAHEEIEEIKNVFGESVPIFGMYTHGETYPFQDTKNMKKIHTQNESIVILAIR